MFLHYWLLIILLVVLLGIGIVVYGIRKLSGNLRKFVVLTGSSILGFFISVLLHNVFYGLFILWFGADFWDRTGLGDEPFFFIVAVFICPLAFLVGAIGSTVLAMRRFKTMSWFSDTVKKLRQVPNPYFFLFITGKVLGGVGIGVLLATWLPIWTWWIFIAAAVAISIPSAMMIFKK